MYSGAPLYSPRLDLSANGCIDMRDVLWVVGLFGQSKPECIQG